MDETTFQLLLGLKTSGTLPDDLSKNQKYVLLRKAKNFMIKDEALYYIRRRGEGGLAKVLRKEEAKDIFTEFHTNAIGAHCGIVKTTDAISKRFYWPSMTVDIRNLVMHCAACQAKQTEIKNKADYTPIEVAEPWEIVGMDLVGKLTPTKNGYQYICVMIDYFTKWCEAFPLKSKSAEEVTGCIVKLFYKFGAPKRLLTDQGTEFVNKINMGVCQLLGIQRSFCAPYHPQTNGLVERLNGTIQRSLSKLVGKQPQNWADYLEATMFGLRTKKQMTTQYSPYFLMFGREARYPCEVPDNYEINESIEDIVAEECVAECIKRHDRIFKTVQENISCVQRKIKKRKLEEGLSLEIKVGDRVLRQNVRSRQRKGGKLDPDYIGPYTVMNVDGKSIDLKDDKGHSCPKINKDHLVHFLEEYPSKVPKLSDSFPVTVSSALPNPPAYTPAASTQPPVCAATIQPAFQTNCPAKLLLQEIWARKKGGTLCSKIGPYKLFTWDIERLRPGEMLESEVINAYLSYLIKNYAGKAYVLDSFQATSIWQGNPRPMKKMNPGAYDVLIGTVNENNHWTLLVIYPNKRRILYLNSLGENRSKLAQCKKAVSKFMATKGNLGENWKCGKVPHCLQKDDNSCGVFVCKFAEAILKGGNLDFENTAANINAIRQDIGLCLLQETEDLSELCLACGDKYPYTEDTEDSWIQCDSCNGWFHWECVNRPNIKDNFVCHGCQGPT